MTKDAGALHCPNCGASVGPDAGRCPYCQARLATVSCPSCFALMFEGAAFCPKCGAARAKRAATETFMRCPECRGAMAAIDIGKTHMLECPACDGIWVDADVFEHLCADRESQVAVLPRLMRKPTTKRVEPVRYRPCLRCGKMMNRVNFGSISGAVVDVCKGHGTFLDAGELHQIVTFIQSGGLDRARAQKLEELHDQERRLRDMERKVAREAFHSREGGSVGWSFDAAEIGRLIDLIKRHEP
jgi:Zn-finger nucleic acid-binding protein